MSRRAWVLIVATLALCAGAVLPALPVSASRARDLTATQAAALAPLLALPSAVLPPNTTFDHTGVSDNPDADGTTTPPDGFQSQIAIVHNPPKYESFGRLTGYRVDFRFPVGDTTAGTEYLASIFPTNAAAKAALDNATTAQFNLLSIIATPLETQCTAGEICRSYAGPQPGTTNKVVFGIFLRGPVLVETATRVPQDKFDALKPALESALYAFLNAADKQIQQVLNGGGPPPKSTDTPTPTSTATATPTATATNTPEPTATKTPRTTCPKHASKKSGRCVCKKGYGKKHGKCVKKKKKI
jgi:hypothetical protein